MKPSTSTTRERAEALHRLHHQDRPLVLVNAWDAASAGVLQHAGAAVIATTSAGMAWSLGRADGEQVPRDEFLAACARICRIAQVPVSIDIERGYGRHSEGVCDFVRALIELGVVGVNIEDGVCRRTGELLAPQALCERIVALRELAAETGVRLFINARTDVYLATQDNAAGRCDETLRRARLYARAGADGLFVPGLHEIDEVARVAREIEIPLNIYAGYAGAPAVDALAAAGVRRVSLGCGPMQSTLALLDRIAAETLTQGRYEVMADGMAKVDDLNRLFSLAPPGAGTR